MKICARRVGYTLGFAPSVPTLNLDSIFGKRYFGRSNLC